MGRGTNTIDRFQAIIGHKRGSSTLNPHLTRWRFQDNHPYISLEPKHWLKTDSNYFFLPAPGSQIDFDWSVIDREDWGDDLGFLQQHLNGASGFGRIDERCGAEIMRLENDEMVAVVAEGSVVYVNVNNGKGKTESFAFSPESLSLPRAPRDPRYRLWTTQLPQPLSPDSEIYPLTTSWPLMPTGNPNRIEWMRNLREALLFQPSNDFDDSQVRIIDHLEKALEGKLAGKLHARVEQGRLVHVVKDKDGKMVRAVEKEATVRLVFEFAGDKLPATLLAHQLYQKPLEWISEPGDYPLGDPDDPRT